MSSHHSSTPRWPWFCITFMALATSALILSHWSDRFTQVLSRGEPPFSSTDADTGLQSRIYTFQEHKILEDLSPSNDEDWHKAALPRKGGFLWVKYNETANEAWGVSMFHALHCLKMLRVAVQRSPYGPVGISGMHEASHHENEGSIGHPDMDPSHLGHCVGYIAQHLLCAADSTLEPPWLTKDDAGDVQDAGVDGEGFQHQCRDPTRLWDVVVQSEQKPIEPWGWQLRDTVESVF